MRLFEAIVDANHRALAGDANAGLHPAEFADALPVIALTCIDPRLNRLIPEVLGVPEAQFIWLRNAGNIIFDTMSSMMRTLALACAVKGGKEIVVIGHTDCQVGKATTMQITDRFRALGVDRSRLPENLNEFFGLFASERQNVIRGTDIIRQSPLIGANVPVHGLLVDIQTGKLEWLSNGYQAQPRGVQPTVAEKVIDALASSAPDSLKQAIGEGLNLVATKLPEFKIGEMKFPDLKIGETTIDPNKWLSEVAAVAGGTAESLAVEAIQGAVDTFVRKFDRSRNYKIIGSDQKLYGPIGGLKVLEWIADGRIGWQTPAQMEGSGEWKPLSVWAESPAPPPIPLPPTLKPAPKLQKLNKH